MEETAQHGGSGPAVVMSSSPGPQMEVVECKYKKYYCIRQAKEIQYKNTIALGRQKKYNTKKYYCIRQAKEIQYKKYYCIRQAKEIQYKKYYCIRQAKEIQYKKYYCIRQAKEIQYKKILLH